MSEDPQGSMGQAPGFSLEGAGIESDAGEAFPGLTVTDEALLQWPHLARRSISFRSWGDVLTASRAALREAGYSVTRVIQPEDQLQVGLRVRPAGYMMVVGETTLRVDKRRARLAVRLPALLLGAGVLVGLSGWLVTRSVDWWFVGIGLLGVPGLIFMVTYGNFFDNEVIANVVRPNTAGSSEAGTHEIGADSLWAGASVTSWFHSGGTVGGPRRVRSVRADPGVAAQVLACADRSERQPLTRTTESPANEAVEFLAKSRPP